MIQTATQVCPLEDVFRTKKSQISQTCSKSSSTVVTLIKKKHNPPALLLRISLFSAASVFKIDLHVWPVRMAVWSKRCH